MAKRSLFSILSEQPWWVSLVVAALLFAGVYQFLPDFAAFVALPFVGVAAHVAWKQFRGRAPADAAERLAALREMSWEEFAAVISAAYRRQGYAVEASQGGAFDFTLRKNGRITLVQCRRWKVNQAGVGPVRELCEAMDRARRRRLRVHQRRRVFRQRARVRRRQAGHAARRRGFGGARRARWKKEPLIPPVLCQSFSCGTPLPKRVAR